MRKEKEAFEQTKKEESWGMAQKHGKTMVRMNMDPAAKAKYDQDEKAAERAEKKLRKEMSRTRWHSATRNILKKQPSGGDNGHSSGGGGGGGGGGHSPAGRTARKATVGFREDVPLESRPRGDTSAYALERGSVGASTWWRDSTNYMYDDGDGDSEYSHNNDSDYSGHGAGGAHLSETGGEGAQRHSEQLTCTARTPSRSARNTPSSSGSASETMSALRDSSLEAASGDVGYSKESSTTV
jgi:hypothetical protein